MATVELTSVATVLRDYIEVEYKDDEHKMLVDIADSIHNANIQPADMLPEYQALYHKQAPNFWLDVARDIAAIDSQLTSDRHRDDLISDYEGMLENN